MNYVRFLRAIRLGHIVIALTTILVTALSAATPWVVARLELKPLPNWWPIVFVISICLSLIFSICAQVRVDLSWGTTVAFSVSSATLAMLVAIDIDQKRLPRLLSLPAFVIVSLGLLSTPGETQRVDIFVGAIGLTVISLALHLLARRSFGIGDVLLSPLLGALVGWFSISAIAIFWFTTAISGALASLIAIALKKTKQPIVIPYGPFMVIGVLSSVIWSVL